MATIGKGRQPGPKGLHAPGRHNTHPGRRIGDMAVRIGERLIVDGWTMDIASSFGDKGEDPMGCGRIHGDPDEVFDRAQPQAEYFGSEVLIDQGLTFRHPDQHRGRGDRYSSLRPGVEMLLRQINFERTFWRLGFLNNLIGIRKHDERRRFGFACLDRCRGLAGLRFHGLPVKLIAIYNGAKQREVRDA